MSLSRLFLTLKGSSTSGNYGHQGRPGKRGGSSSGKVTILNLSLPKSKKPVEVHVLNQDTFNKEAKKILNDDLFELSASTPAVYVYDGSKGVILLKKGFGDTHESLAEEYGHHLDAEAGPKWGSKSDTGIYKKIMDKAEESGEMPGDYQRYSPHEFAAYAFTQYTLAKNKGKFSKENPNLYEAYRIITEHLND